MDAQLPRNQANLRMAEPAELKGAWTVAVPGSASCTIDLRTTRVEAANAYSLGDESGCLAALAAAPIAGWRPAPDGIEIAGKDRRTLLMFADQGDGTAIAATPRGEARLARQSI
ncbi:AprI/Inh family metalloprotease inhibitor [uncultured Sphingomonas sp.]|uniref:AprI/Inh family metalloprotease inhibitor n=1 Tax=uncultured Sphingomonas sp. TaxID=158754 RepID=UPI0025E8C301|nr:AprI/Inh family metalloprotease inhibitor [uncultured Sphingomonas sp.]